MLRQFVLGAALCLMAPAASLADGGYIGAQVGYHDIDGTSGGGLFGLYAGYDAPIAERLVIGAEVNVNLGTSVIDSEYGIAARIGFKASDTALLFARVGYQELDANLQALVENFLGRDLTPAEENDLNQFDVDDTSGGALIGVGGEFDISDRFTLRAVVDTIEFDSVRLTAGFAFKF